MNALCTRPSSAAEAYAKANAALFALLDDPDVERAAGAADAVEQLHELFAQAAPPAPREPYEPYLTWLASLGDVPSLRYRAGAGDVLTVFASLMAELRAARPEAGDR
ncbi:hypothetical protein [Pseudofrankia inefficax]|uniref:Uncharacterized protein n=1 Tax=Pseudofrankia inefficax (strain DSM 45817 / CECT 9037 / DDB 130130 / EuI1c) TaxID=298654 RepID=E3J669_PSEI1|nr:hypothetical protein [Pseudofrankia inefficax]ADP78360.1 hypothetical protein FraEuI1c_0274 [Pseudofrankia inefficax]